MPEGMSFGSVKNLGFGSYGQTKEEWRLGVSLEESPVIFNRGAPKHLPRSPQLKHSSPVFGEELYRSPDPTWALDGFKHLHHPLVRDSVICLLIIDPCHTKWFAHNFGI